MLTPQAVAQVPEFVSRTTRQFERVAGRIPGLQLIRSGERGSQTMLVCSTDTFYEGVVFGQLPQLVTERTGSPRNPVRRDMANERKPPSKRAIAFSDEQIDAILDLWAEQRSALSLPFVDNVYWRDGKARVSK